MLKDKKREHIRRLASVIQLAGLLAMVLCQVANVGLPGWGIYACLALVIFMFGVQMYVMHQDKKLPVIPAAEKDRLSLLKDYAGYDESCQDKPYCHTFVLDGEVPVCLEKYGYAKVISNAEKGTDEMAFRLLHFVCDSFVHDGGVDMGNVKTVSQIVARMEEMGGRGNCRALAKLLAALLCYHGIKARFVTCKPYEDPFDDCHVVVDCQLPSGRRILLDPSFRLYLKDKQGEYVSLEGLRQMLLKEEEMFINPEASHNGEAYSLSHYREYMAKNTFRFSSGICHADGFEEEDRRQVELIPEGYPVEKFADRKRFVYQAEMFWRFE